jgi:hypothetical protein
MTVQPLRRRGTHLEHSPAVHVRRPKVSQESTRLGLDRTELGAFLVQAGPSDGNDHTPGPGLLPLNEAGPVAPSRSRSGDDEPRANPARAGPDAG